MRQTRVTISHKRQALALALLVFSLCTGLQAEAKNNGTLSVSVASVPQSHTKMVQGRVVVDAPPQTVWQILTDYPEWKNRMPGYEQSKILKSSGAVKMLDVAMRVGAFLPACRYQVQAQERQASYQLTFQRVSGDFDEMKALYRLAPQNNGRQTVLSYILNIDVGMPLPGIAGVLKSNTEKSLTALKRYSELEASRSAIGQR